MKRLTLLRHAKASKDDPSMKDFDRPLTEQGREDAALVGAFMAIREMAPDCVLSSPSKRTRETLDAAAPQLDGAPRLLFPQSLYNAPPDRILAAIEAAPEDADCVLVIGHNPGLHVLALNLIDLATSDAGAVVRLGEKFPPGALACYEIAIGDWAEIAGARGALTLFATPKELRGGRDE